MKDKRILYLYIILILLILTVYLGGLYAFARIGDACNRSLGVSYYSIDAESIPEAYDGFRIAQISDLHNASFGKDNERLLQFLEETKPDIIAITGDLVDSDRTDIEIGVAFAREAMQIAPCYYVIGNNEVTIEKYDRLEEELKAAGVIVLHDEAVEITFNDASMRLVGFDDPSLELWKEKQIRDVAKKVAEEAGASEEELGRISKALSSTEEEQEKRLVKRLEKLDIRKEEFTVLLSHRPEFFEAYCRVDADIVLAGHAHGGQFRLNGVGGIYAPGQGLFPKYDAGVYHNVDTYMVVSRGLGNSSFPYRINNPPEIVVVDIK